MKSLSIWTIAIASLVVFSGCAEPESSTFVVQNDGPNDVYHVNVGWLTVTADDEQALLSGACLPKCSFFGASQEDCALGAPALEAVKLAPGEATERSWDGVFYTWNEGDECYEERTDNADFEAEFCYGYEEDETWTEDPESNGPVKDPICEKISFERGGDIVMAAE